MRVLHRRLAKALLRLLGWRAATEKPAIPRYVLVAAPHTSNWDFLYLVLFMWALEIELSFLAKHTLFRGPLGPVIRWLGGIPVVRTGPHQLVERLAACFAERQRMVLLIPPEGTRARAQHWKSGFLHIARAAGVPVVAAAVDWPTRTLRFSEPLAATKDAARLMDTLRQFYRGAVGRHPERVTSVRLREEGDAPSGDAPAPR
ncbi:MAG TPA: 1-acyl-sn-glycerol-3-phosphate acyltransferase [Thermoanaerobaculia bacterium]|nr:1-acyl-sn-glycerol-3-phosphate acyltransferase [Thermoanaerobaculia bacterium]